MPNREHIAYEGNSFVIEWYFTSHGESPALAYYNTLEKEQRVKLLYLLKRMGDAGKISDTTKFNNEGDQIYAFKPKPERFLCFFFKERKIILTHGFRKKQQKLPKNEKERALSLKEDYENRVKREVYYD